MDAKYKIGSKYINTRKMHTYTKAVKKQPMPRVSEKKLVPGASRKEHSPKYWASATLANVALSAQNNAC